MSESILAISIVELIPMLNAMPAAGVSPSPIETGKNLRN